MSFTVKIQLEELESNNTGGNSVHDANMGKIDAAIGAMLPVITAGEALSAGDAVYLKSDGKAYKAKADGMKQPCIGLVKADAAAGAQVSIRREGDFTDSSWSWTAGGNVYLSPSSAGELTQTKPARNVQLIGYALSSTCVIIERQRPTDEMIMTTTTT